MQTTLKKTEIAAQVLPISICVGWAMGTISLGALNFAKNYILLFMTTHLGIAAFTAGLILTFAKVFDALTDPAMGALSDRTETRWGRRRPYLLIGSFLAALGYLILFLVPDFSSITYTIAYMCVAMCLYALAYTVFGVPHLAMSAEITTNYHQRTYLMSYRAVFAIVGISAGGALVPYLIDYFSGGVRMSRPGFEGMAVVMSILVFICCILTFLLTSRARFVSRTNEQNYTLPQQFKLALQNKPFFILLTGKVFFMIASNLVNGTSLFYVTYVIGESAAWLGNFFLVMIFGSLISQPLWLKLSKKFGKRDIYYVGAFIFCCGTISWLWATAEEPQLIFLARAFLLGVSGGGMMLVGNAMLPDTMEYDARRTGLRREGVFAGLYSTMEKLAAAFGAGILGLILGSMGFVESTTGIVEQPRSAIIAIYLCNAVIPVILTITACAVLWFYDLSEEKLENTTKLSEPK